MNFKKNRIRNKLKKYNNRAQDSDFPQTPIFKKPNSDFFTKNFQLITIGLGIIIVIFAGFMVINLVKSLDFGSLVLSFGKELKNDDSGKTNFLLVGTGGAEHDGSNLTDTIIIASFDGKNKDVKMLSLPRDLYIDDDSTGGQRINKVYDTYLYKYDDSEAALEQLSYTITDMTSIPIHYIVKVDFDGFVKIIDALGGVEINVENAIYDPYYPRGETTRYETFQISAGNQVLDGETALKFARSRKTTSDFDRAKRQQQLLMAIKDKALNMKILSDPQRIQNLYNSLADSIETNLTVAEIIELARLSKDINRDNISTSVFSDDFTNCGGFLYTPVREYFGGAAVLLPAGNDNDEIKRFSNNYFYLDYDTQATIQVRNGTKTPGLALRYLNRLTRDCLNVFYYANAEEQNIENSTIYYQLPLTSGNSDDISDNDSKTQEAQKQKLLDTIDIIKQTLDANVVEGIPAYYLNPQKLADTKIVVELGEDYYHLSSADPFTELLYTTPLTPLVDEEEETDDTSASSNTLSSGTAEETDTTSTDLENTAIVEDVTTEVTTTDTEITSETPASLE